VIPLPPDFTAGLSYSHWAGTSVTLHWPDGYRPDSQVLAVEGSVDQDWGAAVRRRGSLSLAVGWTTSTGQLRQLAEDMVARGARALLQRSVKLMDGREAWTPLGLLRVQSAQANIPAGRISVDAMDLGAALADDRFLTPRAIPAGPSRIQIIADLIAETIPGATLTVGPGVVDSAMPAAVWDEDREQACHETARSLGAVLAADTTGGFRLDLASDAPVWTVDAGGVLVSAAMRADREKTYNAVRAAGESTETGAPVGFAYDLDPASPTRWDGPFGRRPRYYSSPLLTTVAQCEAAAASILADSVGLTRSIQFDAIAHPGLEAGDVVTLTSGDVSEEHRVDTVTIPLGTGKLSAKTRVVRVAP
jgi:Arc/MetJ family transcription regulator